MSDDLSTSGDAENPDKHQICSTKIQLSIPKSSMIELAGPGKSNQKISAAVPEFPASPSPLPLPGVNARPHK
jgi:hypothetical protein